MIKSTTAPTEAQSRDAPAQFKFAGKAGSFEGYAAIFGNVDSGGDVILEGAFQEFSKTRDGKTLVLYQHSIRDPIGKAVTSQDSKGLHFRAELALEDPTAKKAYTLMREGIIDCMSIGFDVLPGGAQSKPGRRELSRLKLFEISPVVWGMNTLARIETVKSALDCKHKRALEDLLRESLLLPQRKATAAASVLWPLLMYGDDLADSRDDRKPVNPGELAALARDLDQLTNLLKGN